jgi:hypothetical protein
MGTGAVNASARPIVGDESMRNVLKKILGDPNERELKRLRRIVDEINALEPDYQRLSDEQLRAKTDEFKARLEYGETLDDILVEAFATVREAARRTLNMRHFDVQLMAGIVLHEGKIAEMKTGEGKTLVATLPLYPQRPLGTRLSPRHAERLPVAGRRWLDGADLSFPRSFGRRHHARVRWHLRSHVYPARSESGRSPEPLATGEPARGVSG